MGAHIAQKLGRWAGDWLYPPRCLACEAAVADAHALCAACWRDAAFLDGAVCGRCGALLDASPPPVAQAWRARLRVGCPDCPSRELRFVAVRAAMAYQGVGRALVIALKHRDRRDAARAMGAWPARAGRPLLGVATDLGPPILAPAPLHWTRRALRRGDQAAALAASVAAVWGAPLGIGLLRRRRATPPQTALDREARWRNVADAFVVSADWRRDLAGRRVILVDDVMTTGATLDAGAAALRAAGARRVDALVFARPSTIARAVADDGLAGDALDDISVGGPAAPPPFADDLSYDPPEFARGADPIDEDARWE